MRLIKKIISAAIAAITVMSIVNTGTLISFADTSFDYGDFRFTRTSATTVMVSKYYGDSTNVTLPESVDGTTVTGVYQSCFENTDVVSVTIPHAYKVIGAFAFNGCTQLRTVRLPSSLTSIGIMAFGGCSLLQSIDLAYTNNLSSIAFAAFSGCTSLENLCLPNSITTLGDNVFSGCSSLGEVKLPSGLKVIPEHAFSGCAIESIELPENLTTISEGVFSDNTALNEIDLPYSVTTLGARCFENDTNLSEIFLPETISSIGDGFLDPMSEGSIDVICYNNTYSYAYCEAYGIHNLTDTEKLIGDANLDGVVNINDVTEIQKYIAHIDVVKTYRAKNLADVIPDGKIMITDVTTLQRKLAGMI